MEFTVKVKQFEGPYDVLLHLVRESRIDITDLFISEVTRQYLEFVRLSSELDLNLTADFLRVASRILLIKSRMVVPQDTQYEDDDIDRPRREFIINFLQYAKYKEAARYLENKSGFNDGKYFRTGHSDMQEFEGEREWIEAKLIDLISAYLKIITETGIDKFVTLDFNEKTVIEKAGEILDILNKEATCTFSDLCGQDDSLRFEMILTFYTLLQLVKERRVRIQQKDLFSEIYIEALRQKEGTAGDGTG